MKLATKRILASLVGLSLLAIEPASAQNVYSPRVPGRNVYSPQVRKRIALPKTHRVAQQPILPEDQFLPDPPLLPDESLPSEPPLPPDDLPEGPSSQDLPSPNFEDIAPQPSVPDSKPGAAGWSPSSDVAPDADPGELFPDLKRPSASKAAPNADPGELFPDLKRPSDSKVAPDAVPGELFPDIMTPGQQGSLDMPGVENGLWDGCGPGNCCAVCGGGYCSPPLWYTEHGAKMITRSRPRPVTIAGETSIGLDPVGREILFLFDLMNTRSVNYDVTLGYNATIGRYLGRDSQDRDDFLEFTYWGMNTWVDSNTINSRFLVTTEQFGRPLTFGILDSEFPDNVGGFRRMEEMDIDIHSEMHNWELNLRLRPRGRPDQLVLHPNGRWRRQCTPGTYMSYLVGIRYMTIGDGFGWHNRLTIDDPGLPGVVPAEIHHVTGDYVVQTENNMLGFQIGADLIFRRCKWNWGVQSKVGPYLNFSRGVQEIVNNPTGDPFSSVWLNHRLQSQKQEAALIAEVGFVASYKFKPNLTGRASYDFTWITGVALAPEQLQFVAAPIPFVNTNGTIYSHGLTLGLEWCW